MDTKLLRQKILDLAIRGKLVPQDPNDEPASVLLERIKAEKEQLIKEGKIKRSKKTATTSDSRHYPFELPSGWVWATIEEIAESNIGLTYKPSDISEEGIPVYRSNNIQDRKICLDNLVRVQSTILPKQYLNEGDLLICARNGSRNLVGKCALITELYEPTSFGAFMAVCRSIFNPWIFIVLNSNYFNQYLNDSNSTAINQVTQKMLLSFQIPLPPIKQQNRIITEIENWFAVIDEIEKGKSTIEELISQTKAKILNLAIHGKLVPQDPADEPAIELLKRVNPSAEITCDNEHYPKLPENWVLCKLEDIVDYEQPTLYIVYSTEYKDTFATPVLTAGKSFIIGRTNETNGIYSNLPCIIFDDFTTDSKYVDFPFKVKSSAMKILKVKDEILPKYVAMFMSITRLIGKTHKRYWISEYSKIQIPIPPKQEQQRIISAVENLNKVLDNITESL